MISTTTIYALVSIAAIGIVPLLRFYHHKVRQSAKQEVMDAVRDAFVVDMATNHLPHIYHALGIICEALKVELTEPPTIKFISLEGTNGTDKASHTRTD